MHRIDGILESFLGRVEAHRLAEGGYSRYLWQDTGGTRRMGANAYGCADAANLLYTLCRFPSEEGERAALANAIRAFQDPQSGHFLDPTHADTHTTAHCVAALELFEAKPAYPLTALRRLCDFRCFTEEMEEADFLHRGRMAHFGAGAFAALYLAGDVGDEWIERYFSWLDAQCDPETGMWVKQPTVDFKIPNQMGDAFHYLFNYEYMHRAFPYPERLIDSCLGMYRDGSLPASFGRQFHFLEVDFVFCLNRASRQTAHRYAEVKETLSEFCEGYLAYLAGVDYERSEGANDMHLLFGTSCCLAELAAALPGEVYAQRPLRLVLDRRPFI